MARKDNIGIIGLSSSGKTSYIHALTLKARSTSRWKFIKSDVLAPVQPGDPIVGDPPDEEAVIFDICTVRRADGSFLDLFLGRRYSLTVPDMSGEVWSYVATGARGTSEAVTENAAKVLAHAQSCRGLICLVDIAGKDQTQAALHAGLVINCLKKSLQKRKSSERVPVRFIISKFDLLLDDPGRVTLPVDSCARNRYLEEKGYILSEHGLIKKGDQVSYDLSSWSSSPIQHTLHDEAVAGDFLRCHFPQVADMILVDLGVDEEADVRLMFSSSWGHELERNDQGLEIVPTPADIKPVRLTEPVTSIIDCFEAADQLKAARRVWRRAALAWLILLPFSVYSVSLIMFAKVEPSLAAYKPNDKDLEPLESAESALVFLDEFVSMVSPDYWLCTPILNSVQLANMKLASGFLNEGSRQDNSGLLKRASAALDRLDAPFPAETVSLRESIREEFVLGNLARVADGVERGDFKGTQAFGELGTKWDLLESSSDTRDLIDRILGLSNKEFRQEVRKTDSHLTADDLTPLITFEAELENGKRLGDDEVSEESDPVLKRIGAENLANSLSTKALILVTPQIGVPGDLSIFDPAIQQANTAVDVARNSGVQGAIRDSRAILSEVLGHKLDQVLRGLVASLAVESPRFQMALLDELVGLVPLVPERGPEVVQVLTDYEEWICSHLKSQLETMSRSQAVSGYEKPLDVLDRIYATRGTDSSAIDALEVAREVKLLNESIRIREGFARERVVSCLEGVARIPADLILSTNDGHWPLSVEISRSLQEVRDTTADQCGDVLGEMECDQIKVWIASVEPLREPQHRLTERLRCLEVYTSFAEKLDLIEPTKKQREILEPVLDRIFLTDQENRMLLSTAARKLISDARSVECAVAFLEATQPEDCDLLPLLEDIQKVVVNGIMSPRMQGVTRGRQKVLLRRYIDLVADGCSPAASALDLYRKARPGTLLHELLADIFSVVRENVDPAYREKEFHRVLWIMRKDLLRGSLDDRGAPSIVSDFDLRSAREFGAADAERAMNAVREAEKVVRGNGIEFVYYPDLEGNPVYFGKDEVSVGQYLELVKRKESLSFQFDFQGKTYQVTPKGTLNDTYHNHFSGVSAENIETVGLFGLGASTANRAARELGGRLPTEAEWKAVLQKHPPNIPTGKFLSHPASGNALGASGDVVRTSKGEHRGMATGVREWVQKLDGSFSLIGGSFHRRVAPRLLSMPNEGGFRLIGFADVGFRVAMDAVPGEVEDYLKKYDQ